jgi:2-hydroxy-3-oxopropionate reductase
MKQKIGFIGTGIMGKPMAENILKAGYELHVYNHRESSKLKELVALGAIQASSPKELASRTDVIITMVPDSPEVEAVVLGADGVVEGAREGAIVIDMSSISPVATKRIAAQLLEKGIHMMDAPVSGGEAGAIKGTLAIMVGGTQEDFDACLDLYKSMGASVTLVGDIGAGHTTKLANNMIAAINIAAVAEALVFVAKAGVDPTKVFEAIKGGSAGSSVMNDKMPKMIRGDINPGFRVNLHIKDLKNAIDTGREIGTSLFLTNDVMEIMQTLKTDGFGLDDTASIVTFYEKLAKIRVSEQG